MSQDRARELVFRYGWNTTCFQVLNPEISRQFGNDWVVGYAQRGRYRIAAGAPIAEAEHLMDAVRAFESHSKVCWFAAESRLLDAAEGYGKVVMGAQPMWHPKSWLANVAASASLRAQLSRARNKGMTVAEWDADRVRASGELRECRDQWLRTRGLPPMHFLNESDVLNEPEGRRVFVMEADGHVFGFVVLAPIPARNGWLTELFVRGEHAPNGTIELGLHFAVQVVAAEGAELLTMGMVPLSTCASQAENPGWLRVLASWARAHGRRFYNFDGLESFKAKFKPDSWEPIYVVSKPGQFGFRMLLAMLGAFTRVHPVWALMIGVGRAIGQEVTWVLRGR